MSTGLSRIEPQHPRHIVPKGAEIWGQTENGETVYRLVTRRSKSEPVLDEEGNQKWRMHPDGVTALVPLRKPIIYNHEELFILRSDGQFNMYKEPFIPPTEEELQAQEREKKVTEVQRGLAEALVDEGLSANELVERLSEPAAPVDDGGEELVEPESVEPEPVEYPEKYGVALYRLSDGTSFRGSEEDAEMAEIALREATGFEED